MESYVGIDLHRRRSVVVVLNKDGDRVSWSRIDNTPGELGPGDRRCRRAGGGGRDGGDVGLVLGC